MTVEERTAEALQCVVSHKEERSCDQIYDDILCISKRMESMSLFTTRSKATPRHLCKLIADRNCFVEDRIKCRPISPHCCYEQLDRFRLPKLNKRTHYSPA